MAEGASLRSEMRIVVLLLALVVLDVDVLPQSLIVTSGRVHLALQPLSLLVVAIARLLLLLLRAVSLREIGVVLLL